MPLSHQISRSIPIGIPAYNAHNTLHILLKKILPLGHPIVICDDGSETALGDTLPELNTNLNIIRHQKNRGKAAALRTLYKQAIAMQASALLVMDADGQHPPEHIKEFLSAHKKFPNSLILGNRLSQAHKIPAIRRLGICSADFLLTLITGKKICDSQCGMRLIPAALLPHLLSDTTQGFAAESSALIIAIKNGHTLANVPIPALYDLQQQSHYRTLRDTVQIGAHLALQLLKPKKV
jgi:glycosyltransferase involved in cell wall biosynthesis